MIQLTAQQRQQLIQMVEGNSSGSYLGAVVALNLADGKDRTLNSRTCFCTSDEIAQIEQLFEQGD